MAAAFRSKLPLSVSARHGGNLTPSLCCVSINALKKFLSSSLAGKHHNQLLRVCQSQQALGPEGLRRGLSHRKIATSGPRLLW